MEIREIENKDTWERFASAYIPNTFLQSWGWGEYQKLSGNKTFRLGLFENGEIFGLCLVTFIKAKKGSFLYCQHGPLMDWGKKETFKVLLSKLKEIGQKEGAWFIRLTPLLADTHDNRTFIKSLAFNSSPVHNIDAQVTLILDLSLAEENLLKNMRKSTRYEIKKDQKSNTRVFTKTDQEGLAEFYRLYQEMVQRQKFVPYSFIRFENEFKAFAPLNQQKIFFAENAGVISSAAIINLYGQTAFYNHGASVISSKGISTAHFLQWEIIKYVKSRGLRFYNFWGGVAPNTKHPWWGITVFKKGFGGRQMSYLHAQDFPLRKEYYFTALIERIRRSRMGL